MMLNGTFVKTKSIKDSVLSVILVAVLITWFSWKSVKIDFSSSFSSTFRQLMLKSPVNIFSLFSDDTLISELRRSSLKFVGRNFDVDGDQYHTLIRKLFVLGKFISSQIYSNPLTSKSVLLINGMPSFI